MIAAVRTAGPGDRDTVGRLMVDALLPTPDAAWIEPDLAARANLYRALVGRLFDFTHLHGSIDVVTVRAQPVGAALWWPYRHGQPDVGYVVALSYMLDQISPAATKRIAQFSAHLAVRYPVEAAHHYLAYIGVLRHRQSHGYGSALLTHRLADLDAAGHAAYLMASSPQSARMFARHGFHVRDGSPSQLPDGPPVWGMLREPCPTPPCSALH